MDRIILLCVCLAFTIVMVTLHFNLYNYREKQMSATKESMITIANNQTKQFDNFLNDKMNILKFLAQYPDIYEMDWNRQYEFLKLKTKLLGFHHTFVMDMNGMGYYVSTKSIKDQSGEPFFYDVMNHEDFITQPFYGEDTTTITLCTSIYGENDQKVGVLCGTIELSKLCDSISDDFMILDGMMFLLNSKGAYVASSSSSLFHASYSVFRDEKIDSSLFRQTFASQSSQSGQIEIDGISYEAYMNYLPQYEWIIVVCVPTESILHNIDHISNLQHFADLILIVGILGVIHIIISWRISDKKSTTDQLTNAQNRAALNQLMERLEKMYQIDIAILYMDLNLFKQINDTYGHDFGDQVLCVFYKVLADTFGKEGFVCRMGGDEFVCVLVNVTEEDILTIWEKVCDQLIAESEKLNLSTPVTSSIGYSFRHKGEKIPLELVIDQADKNMYQYKEKNREKC